MHDACPFLDVRKSAFAIMSKEDIQIVGHKMLKGPKQKKEFKWQEIDKAHRLYKKRLRPLLMRIDFSSEVPNNPWLISTQWLQKIFANNQKLSDRPFNECPNDTIVNHIVFGAVKNPVIASYNLPNSVILSLIHLFILAQNFSIGFKSGEYGGRKIILQPTDSMSSLVFCDL